MTNEQEEIKLAKFGEEVAEMLMLRKDKEHQDRWQTTWGSKTNVGLARCIIRVVEDFQG